MTEVDLPITLITNSLSDLRRRAVAATYALRVRTGQSCFDSSVACCVKLGGLNAAKSIAWFTCEEGPIFGRKERLGRRVTPEPSGCQYIHIWLTDRKLLSISIEQPSGGSPGTQHHTRYGKTVKPLACKGASATATHLLNMRGTNERPKGITLN